MVHELQGIDCSRSKPALPAVVGRNSRRHLARIRTVRGIGEQIGELRGGGAVFFDELTAGRALKILGGDPHRSLPGRSLGRRIRVAAGPGHDPPCRS